MNEYELISLVKEYIANVEVNNRKGARIDLFHSEDRLNRELGVNLFDINMEDKVNFVLNQPRVSSLLVAA